MTEQTITHDTLVKAATNWLGTFCKVVASEPPMPSTEQPDVIGWTSHGCCHVVECKISRSDFKADHKKPFNQNNQSVGDKRWFFVPRGLITKEEIPEEWGLIEYCTSKHSRGYYIKSRIDAPFRQRDPSDISYMLSRKIEHQMLVSITARALKGVHLLKCLWLGEEVSDENKTDR